MRILFEIALKSQRNETSKYNSKMTHINVDLSIAKRETRHLRVISPCKVLQRPGFYASRVDFAFLPSSFYAAASLVRVLLKEPPHMHWKATEEKHGVARVAAARKLAINRSTGALFPLNPEKLRDIFAMASGPVPVL